MPAPSRSDLKRRRDGPAAAVTQIELFFDLVFVFALTQISHFMLERLTPVGLAQSALLFGMVWWVWIYTAWVTNWLDPERRPVRGALLALMLAGLVLSTSIPEAFGDRALPFAAAYLVMQVGRSLFALWAVRGDPALRPTFLRILFWQAISGVFWLWGALAGPGQRLPVWSLAVAVELAAPASGYRTPALGRSATTDWKIDGGHMAERCSAFVLIALGESLTVTGTGFAGVEWTSAAAAAFAAAFAGAVALWWIYFDTAAENTRHAFARSEDPGRLGRSAYTYVHGAIVAGVVVTAVGWERVLAHPLAAADPVTAAVVVGGPALYLLSNGAFRRLLAPRFAPSHLLGLVLLAACAAVSPWFSRVGLAGAVTGAVTLTAVAGSLLYARMRARVSRSGR